LSLTALLLYTAAYAQNAKQVEVGARAIAMGGAFAGLANDATALSWNPAASAWLQRQELGITYADRFGLGLNNSYLSYVQPVTENHALGLDWFFEGFNDEDKGLGLNAGRNHFGLGYAYRNNIAFLQPFLANSALGVRGRYFSQNIDLDGAKALGLSGWGWDVGLLAPLPYGLRLGVVAQHIGGTSLKHDSGISEKVFPAYYRLGLAYKSPVIEGLTVTTDLDDHFRLGAEYWLKGQLALRAGFKSEMNSPESFADASTPTVGLGIKYRFLQFDYAYERHPVLNATHYTTLSLAFNNRVITIKDATIRRSPIFRSLYQHYQENEFFDVVLSNAAQEPVEVTVGLMLPKMMSVPHQEKVVLPPQSSAKYAFKVTFDQDLFNQPEASYDNFVTPEITVTYSRNGREQPPLGKLMERVYVAGKGKLSWNIDGMAAAFVTPADLAVAGMARGLVQRHNDMLARKFNRSNIGKAMLLFNAMGSYKIRYQADQKTPFASISDDKTIFDTVQYPSELLALPLGTDTKIGDCDDLTVLFASLLENLSIDTAFLEANDPGKGHIYLMFDSGIKRDRAEDHFTSPNEYVDWQGRIWIPVETTMFGFTFADAWRNGAAEYKRLKPKELINEVYVQQWMQIYKPAVLPPIPVQLPLAAMMDSLLSKDIAFFDDRTDRIAMGAGASEGSPDGLYDIGVAYLRVNHLDKAYDKFNQVLSLKPNHYDALNGLGVVMTRQSRFDKAMEYYQRALAVEENNGIRMNIALTYYLMGEREQADKLFGQVVALDNSYGELFDFLADVGDAQTSYEAGVGYLRQLKLEQALEQFNLALDADPQFADALNGKGVVLTRQSRYDEAMPLFEQAAVLVPEQLGYQLNIALIHSARGNRKAADVIYRQVVAQNAEYDGLFDFLSGSEAVEEDYNVAVKYLQQDRYDKALEQLNTVLAANPLYFDALNTKGVILAKQGRNDEAYSAFEGAGQVEPGQAGVRLNMAIIRYVQGRQDEAVQLYRQVLSLDSRYQGMLDFLEEEDEALFDFMASSQVKEEEYRLAAGYLQQARHDQAIEHLDGILAIDPQYVDALNAKGVALAHQGANEEAFRLFEQAAGLAPDHAGMVLNMALMRYVQGRQQDAATLYRKAVGIDQRYSGTLTFLAGDHVVKADAGEALDFIERAAAVEQNYQLAVGYLQQDRIFKALENLDAALAINPQNTDVLNAKGVVLAKQGQNEAAYALFEEAAALAPDHAGIVLNMALMRYIQGRQEDAKVLFQQVIKLDERYQGLFDFIGQ
jgi:tetratricopeptide (TPR) repeat protein